MSAASIAADAARELDKVADVLAAAERHFEAAGVANAALHLSETVHLNPLAAKVALARTNAQAAAERFRAKAEA